MTSTKAQSAPTNEKHSAGLRLLGERGFAKASAILKEAFDEAPTSILANDCAVAETLCGRAVEAERSFMRALALDADNAKAAMNVAVLLAVQKRFQEAIPFLEKAAGHLDEGEQAAALDLLKRCRVQAKVVADRESRAAVRDLVRQRQRAFLPGGPEGATDYWFPDITGWFLRAEALHLYTAIKLTQPRRILEIGTFFGRSTATICAAIKSLENRTEFVTVDLDFRTEEQARKAFEEIHARDVVVPEEFREAFELGFSTTEYAEYCVRKHRLAQYVIFESGDFRTLPGQFDFAFADVMHDPVEIEKNLPAILRMLCPGGILAVHDLNHKNKQCIEAIAGSIEFVSNSESLGIFRMHGKMS
ncbi:MAG TPA: class I SAM-dependent methyltransferase [Candidatus Bathyarchaeia archaeon]|nr:class I SAM-dependent methyltransferase [Candidatus Bathyarchaeia archaeon]